MDGIIKAVREPNGQHYRVCRVQAHLMEDGFNQMYNKGYRVVSVVPFEGSGTHADYCVTFERYNR